MNKEEIVKKLNKIFTNVFGRDIQVTYEMTADDIPEWDSIAHMNLILSIESEFGISFALGEIQDLKNVGEMISLIEEKTK